MVTLKAVDLKRREKITSKTAQQTSHFFSLDTSLHESTTSITLTHTAISFFLSLETYIQI